MKRARFNLVVVLVLLAAFLLVQADLPISQAVAIRASATHSCCCSLEMQTHGACCCSQGMQSKSGCSLRASPCGETAPSDDTIIVVKFQVVLPVLTIALLPDVARKPARLAAIGASTRPAEPPVPPPRFLIPA